MKIFRYVVMAVLFLGLSGVARAYTFQVLDPPSGPGFAIVEPGVEFPVSFVPCLLDPADGCFLGFNESKTTALTTLDFTFPNTPALGGQDVNCSTVGSLFGSADCSLVGDEYMLDFSDGGGIPPWTFFLVVEQGICPGDFPHGRAVGDPTPEPSSIWLALSGMGSLAYAVRRRRKNLAA